MKSLILLACGLAAISTDARADWWAIDSAGDDCTRQWTPSDMMRLARETGDIANAEEQRNENGTTDMITVRVGKGASEITVVFHATEDACLASMEKQGASRQP